MIYVRAIELLSRWGNAGPYFYFESKFKFVVTKILYIKIIQMDLEDLEYILDHYKSPRNYGELTNPDISQELGNPICGDKIRLDLKLEGHLIKDIKFSGQGCTISQAAASILTEEVINKDLEYIDSFKSEEMFEIIKAEVSPIRYDCALLALKVLKTAIKSFRKNPA